MTETNVQPTRRSVLIGAASAAAFGVPLVQVRRAQATPDMMKAAVHRVIGEAPVRQGRVTLDIPPLVENGNTIAMSVKVDSPMTATDYVKAIHVFNEKNRSPTSSRFTSAPAPARRRSRPASGSPICKMFWPSRK